MKILMTGATGFIGTPLVERLISDGHQLLLVTRDISKAQHHFKNKPEFIECDLNSQALPVEVFTGIEAIINLAGESIQGRWTKEKKKSILGSRLNASRNLLANCPASVKTIITASAQGIYGNRGSEELTENSSAGGGFLAEVCKSWEAEFTKIKGKRLIILRLGIVLANNGGALKKLLPIFKNNLGAPLGSGFQWMSFISLHDLVRLIAAAVVDSRYEGVINAVNKEPVTNTEFTKQLCQQLHVLKLPRVPEFAIRLAMGEMSELVLNSLRLKPEKLEQLNFRFDDPDLLSIFKRYL